LGSFYTTNAINWTANSSWYLIETIESFNGERVPNYISPDGGHFIWWFASNAFGGSSYSNTPVGAVSNTDEPNAIGSPGYFGFWQAGMNFGICAWNSRNANVFQAIGDPFVTR
jgi:hypothetical protein